MALVMTAGGLAACATQQGMTVEARMTNPAPPKYRNALAIRSVTGGQAMNVLTVPGVPNEPFKAALESSLAANGYLARAGAPRYQVDAEIQDLQQPLIGLDLEVTAAVNYKVSGAGTAATYPIKATAKATFSDSPIAADRMRIANERAMQQNIRMFMEALR
jgi:hypothetical protein